MAEIARALATPLLPWQQLVADVAGEVDDRSGRLVYREVRLTVPRQSGKTTLLLSEILCRAIAMGPPAGPRQRITYTAQTGSDARSKWQDDWLPVLDRSPFRKTYRPRLTNGHEALLFRNGSIQGLMASTKKSGHGASLDMGVIDEAFAQTDSRLEQANKPAMITRPEPQLWVVSTAGTPDDSPYLLEKVESGRRIAEAGDTSGVCYFEWSAADEMDPSDPSTWWACMPALGYTITEEAVASDFASMPLNEFERAYLNRWKATTVDPVIPLELWARCWDERSAPSDPVSFAFDVAPDRDSAAISVAGDRPDSRIHLEVVDHHPGTDWVARRLAELKARWRPTSIACDPGGPAGSLLPAVAKLGIEVVEIGASDHAKACGMFKDRVTGAMVAHRDQPMMSAALDGARKRPLGDAWAWSRKNSGVDISPLVSMTLALWTHEQFRPAKPTPRVVSLADALQRADMAERSAA